MLQTTIPASDAAVISILSTPTPPLPMNVRLGDWAITSSRIFVALRTITAS